MTKYILALDQGTTSSRAILFGHDGRAVASAHAIKTTMYLSTAILAPAVVAFWASRWTIRKDMES